MNFTAAIVAATRIANTNAPRTILHTREGAGGAVSVVVRARPPTRERGAASGGTYFRSSIGREGRCTLGPAGTSGKAPKATAILSSNPIHSALAGTTTDVKPAPSGKSISAALKSDTPVSAITIEFSSMK